MQMAAAPVMATAASSTATVDVVLGYSPGFAADHGGTSGAVTRLNYLVDVANTAYTNSGINAKVRLVHAMQVTYTDSSSNDSTLQKLTGYDTTTNHQTTPDPAFNALRAARDQYGADLVSLVRSYRDPENDGCGIAWLIGGGQSGISTSDSYFGYSVVSDGTDAGTDGHTYYCLDETLAHEMGHNMGAAHDVETSKGDDGTLDPEDYGAYSYSFGYKTTATHRKLLHDHGLRRFRPDALPHLLGPAQHVLRRSRLRHDHARPTMRGPCRRRFRPSRHSGPPPVSPCPPACC